MLEHTRADEIFEMFEKEKTLDVLAAIRALGYSKADHTEDLAMSSGWTGLAVEAGELSAMIKEIHKRSREWDEAEKNAEMKRKLRDEQAKRLIEMADALMRKAEKLRNIK